MLQFLKNWTLPVAMFIGALSYLLFAKLPFLAPLKPFTESAVSYITPILIFIMLFLTFCKVSLHELKPKRWHLLLIVFQLITCLVIAGFLVIAPGFSYKVVAEAAMVCLICPTATAAAVITGKLGGNASSLTTYTILSNSTTAIVVPIIFPLVEPHEGLTFLSAFLVILGKIFPLLICPFIAAMLIRYFFPKALQQIIRFHGMAFYLWSIALIIVVAQTIRSVVNSQADTTTLLLVGGAGLFTCCLQFFLGKRIGGYYNDRISGGQGLGQKNTVFAIWMSYTYLNPLSSLGPGSYVLWQNLINSWQLWKKRKREEDKQNSAKVK